MLFFISYLFELVKHFILVDPYSVQHVCDQGDQQYQHAKDNESQTDESGILVRGERVG